MSLHLQSWPGAGKDREGVVSEDMKFCVQDGIELGRGGPVGLEQENEDEGGHFPLIP